MNRLMLIFYCVRVCVCMCVCVCQYCFVFVLVHYVYMCTECLFIMSGIVCENHEL